MRLPSQVLAAAFVPLAVAAGVLRGIGAADAAELAVSIAGAWGSGALALWAVGEAATWWSSRARVRAGGWR